MNLVSYCKCSFWAAVLIAACSRTAFAINVLIGGTPHVNDWLFDVQAKIVATGQISGNVDVFDNSAGLPTLAQLQAYDAVLIFTDDGIVGDIGLGNTLASYVDSGGGVVQMTFSYWNTNGPGIRGLWQTGGYSVWQTGQQASPGGLTLGTIYDPNSPILAGVTSFNGGASSYYNTVPGLNPGAVAIADWSNGAPLIAANTQSFSGRVVGLNFYPVSSDANSTLGFWDASTDGGLLMANALNFAAAPEPSAAILAIAGMLCVLASRAKTWRSRHALARTVRAKVEMRSSAD